MPPQSTKPLPAAARQMLETNERVIRVVRKSLVVLIGLYLEILAAVVALVAILLVINSQTVTDLITSQSVTSLIIAVLLVALASMFFILVTFIYLANQLVITDRSLIQVTQRGPFSNKASRLSYSNVEDVEADQSGLLATIFSYGTLTVQTAGTIENFIYTYCPSPNHFAHEVLEAQQAYAQSLREDRENL
jgi:hypothetical protein